MKHARIALFFLAGLGTLTAIAQRTPPTQTWRPKACAPNQPCQPTCPVNDPNGCGIFSAKQ